MCSATKTPLASMMQTIEAGGDASEITGATSKLAQQLGVK